MAIVNQEIDLFFKVRSFEPIWNFLLVTLVMIKVDRRCKLCQEFTKLFNNYTIQLNEFLDEHKIEYNTELFMYAY